jgi:predicted Zn-dependent protease
VRGKESDGAYISDKNIIVMRKSLTDEQAMETLLHELGHALETYLRIDVDHALLQAVAVMVHQVLRPLLRVGDGKSF